MRRIRLWTVVCCCLLLLPGCGASEPDGPPSPSELATLCQPLAADSESPFPQAYRARRELLVRALQDEIIKSHPADIPAAVADVAPCLRAEVVPESEARVYQAWLQVPGRTIGPFLIYPFKTGVIHMNALDTPEGTGAEILPLHTVHRGGELDMSAKRVASSSSDAGRLQLYRLTNGLTLLWESPEYQGFDAVTLDADWVLTLHRPAESPARDGEVLWHREGPAFRRIAAHTFPSPLRAAAEFVGALQKGDRASAAQWATTPAVVDAGATALGRLKTTGWTEAVRAVDLAEAFSWSEIPPELRGPDPAAARVVLPSGPYQVVVTRTESGWRVSAVE